MGRPIVALSVVPISRIIQVMRHMKDVIKRFEHSNHSLTSFSLGTSGSGKEVTEDRCVSCFLMVIAPSA